MPYCDKGCPWNTKGMHCISLGNANMCPVNHLYEENQVLSEEVRSLRTKALPYAPGETIMHRKAFDKFIIDSVHARKQNGALVFDYFCKPIFSDVCTLISENDIIGRVLDKRIHLSDGIECLGLTTRAFNGLRRKGCRTVADVVAAMESGAIYHIRGLGERSVQEIELMLECVQREEENNHENVQK